jgi:hypothetical protein
LLKPLGVRFQIKLKIYQNLQTWFVLLYPNMAVLGNKGFKGFYLEPIPDMVLGLSF